MEGNFCFRFGSPGSRDGHFQSPSGVAVTREGNIVVADTMNNRIQVCIHFGVERGTSTDTIKQLVIYSPDGTISYHTVPFNAVRYGTAQHRV